MTSEDLAAVARTIRTADEVVALTGAGVSTASGVPDFRSDDGLWRRYDPSDFHIDRFRTDPGAYWTQHLDLHDEFFADDIDPNAAHEALADLEAAGHLETLLTQNVDGLHSGAGSESIVRLHGTAAKAVCRSCRRRYDIEPAVARARDGALPPSCEDCGGALKPDTVLFGERLPNHARLESQAAAQSADVFLAIGSSLTVEPAASLPRTAADRGATLAIVNLEETPLADRADYAFREDATDVVPRLRDAIVGDA
ncbi:SIR2 family NAD-dependent protein deacylase [Halosolutus gelatinilyticus]|uniref:SIR2 family NAD-dependent protein deacylase n=1 Tax=Halosolutus gelatinilyticus TaxID=2931975 RepID=UPI001FF5E993|nr:Sir2 family NAD-dependent protein deacetylase [Halosolutus gelatinilyticus]